MTTQTLIRKLNIDIEQLKAKIRIIGALRRFETLAGKGRKFASKKNIRPSDVLKDD